MTPLERLFHAYYDDNDDVATLKEKVKAKKSNACENINTDCLTIWQYKEPKLLTDVNANKLEDTLKKVDVSDCRKVVELAGVISIELFKNEILLVQLPSKCSHSPYNFTILIYQ